MLNDLLCFLFYSLACRPRLLQNTFWAWHCTHLYLLPVFYVLCFVYVELLLDVFVVKLVRMHKANFALLPFVTQSDYNLCEWLYEFISKNVIATQKLNFHHCREELKQFISFRMKVRRAG
jgi:hypothetical protein